MPLLRGTCESAAAKRPQPVASAGAASWQSSGKPQNPSCYLWGHMLFFVRNAMLAFYPRTGDLPGLEDTDIDTFLPQFRRETSFMFWLGIVLSAWLFQWTPLFTVFIPLPAFLLPKSLRDKHASRIGSSELYLVRQAMLVLKMPAGLCWGRHPDVRKRFALPAYAADPTTWKTS